MSPEEKAEVEGHLIARSEIKYQNEWRDLVKKERAWVKLIKNHDTVFGTMLEIWCTTTELLLDYAFEKYKKVKITSFGSKDN